MCEQKKKLVGSKCVAGPSSKRIKMQFVQKDGRESCIEGKNIFPVSKFHKYEGKIQKQLKYI